METYDSADTGRGSGRADWLIREVERLREERRRLAARVETQAEATNRLCHDLRGALTPLLALAELVERDIVRGQHARAAVRARQLAEWLRERRAAIDEAQARALGD